VRLEVPPDVLLAGVALDDEVQRVLERFGLHEEEERDAPG
jgi:hypothetical protein